MKQKEGNQETLTVALTFQLISEGWGWIINENCQREAKQLEGQIHENVQREKDLELKVWWNTVMCHLEPASLKDFLSQLLEVLRADNFQCLEVPRYQGPIFPMMGHTQWSIHVRSIRLSHLISKKGAQPWKAMSRPRALCRTSRVCHWASITAQFLHRPTPLSFFSFRGVNPKGTPY